MKVIDLIYRAASAVWHRLSSVNTLGHHIHSPHLYYLVRFIIYDDNSYYCFSQIERERQRLLRARREIFVEDYGTGCSGNRRISTIASQSLANPKEGQLLFRIVNHLKPQTIIELGTSLGITTAYLAKSNSKAQVITLEGSESIVEQAKKVHSQLGLHNIQYIVGDIDQTLPDLLLSNPLIDLAFLDANHTYEATIRYFNQISKHCHKDSIIVMDDIHYSTEMAKAWAKVQQSEGVSATMDLYDMGIVFFDPQYEHRNYKLRI